MMHAKPVADGTNGQGPAPLGAKARRERIGTLLISYVIVAFANMSLVYFDRAALDNSWVRFLPSIFMTTKFYALFEIFCLYRLISYLRAHIDRWPIIYLLPAVFFSLWMVEGHYFETPGGVDFLYTERFFAALCCLYALAYTVIYYLCFVLADYLFTAAANRLCPRDEDYEPSPLARFVDNHPFVVAFVFLGLATALLCFVTYPGLFQGDAKEQIRQALGQVPYYNKHPIVHTLLIKLCLHLGLTYFGSYNAGIFINVVIQSVALVAAFAFCVQTLVRCVGVRGYTALILPLVFIVHPRCLQYMAQITKDTLYLAFMLSFISCTIRLVWEKGSRYELIPWTIFAIGTVLFRRDGFYFIICSVALMMIRRDIRMKAITLTATLLVFFSVWNRVVLPAMNVVPGSSRVVYSLVFQGTARYLCENPDDVTPAEHDAIDKVLHYDKLRKKYEPELADKVIRTYRDEATRADMTNYFKATWSMFKRHPKSFLRAIFHNKYRHFYPSQDYERSYSFLYDLKCMDDINRLTGVTDFHLPDFQHQAYYLCHYAREGFWHLPGLCQLMSSYAVMCLAAFLLCYALRKRYRRVLILLTIVTVQIGILFFGPTNGGYFRYTFPILTILVVCFLLLCKTVSEKQGSDGVAAVADAEGPSTTDLPEEVPAAEELSPVAILADDAPIESFPDGNLPAE